MKILLKLKYLIDPYYFDIMADPVRGKIYPAAVSTGLDPFFDHLFAVDFEFYFVVGKISGVFVIFCFVFFRHNKRPFGLLG